MWLESPEIVAKIESQELDYRQFMKLEENHRRDHVSTTSHIFTKPSFLEKKLKDINSNVKLNIEGHQKEKEQFLQKLQEAKEKSE